MPNRAGNLEWDGARTSPARTELIDAALAIADEAGLDGVSIRRVAGRTGMRTMSVYTHVASKDDLLALMFERISAELIVPAPLPRDGRELLRLIAQRAFDAYLAHPWMLHAFGRRAAPGPNQLRRAEQSATAVRSLKIPPAKAWTALSIVHEWTMGHAVHAVTLREDITLNQRLETTANTNYPNATQALKCAQDRSTQAVFEEALDSVLDGIEQRFKARADQGHQA
ncbi:MAG: TetR/AcrR family transcriptional regulator [Solirubrobacteraceae bacterium]